MTKERGISRSAKRTKMSAPIERRARGESAADRQRATQLLATANTRDLTADEMRVLSVVQLSEYAAIQRNRQKRTR
jgi:hypothetical protein